MCYHRCRALILYLLIIFYTMNVSTATRSSRRLLFAENKVLAPLHDVAGAAQADTHSAELLLECFPSALPCVGAVRAMLGGSRDGVRIPCGSSLAYQEASAVAPP